MRTGLVVAFLFFSLGCARTPWTVVRASGPPSSLRGVPAIGVVLDATELLIDGRPLSAMSELDREEAMGALVAFEAHFRNELLFRANVPVLPADDSLPAGAATVTVRLLVLAVDPGLGGSRSELSVVLDWSVGGAVTDAIALDAWPYRGRRVGMWAAWSQSRRLVALAEELAEAAAAFFRREQSR